MAKVSLNQQLKVKIVSVAAPRGSTTKRFNHSEVQAPPSYKLQVTSITSYMYHESQVPRVTSTTSYKYHKFKTSQVRCTSSHNHYNLHSTTTTHFMHHKLQSPQVKSSIVSAKRTKTTQVHCIAKAPQVPVQHSAVQFTIRW